MYDIQSKNDLQSGATLVVSIPEEDLDKKALYTILADQPDFILPFRQRVFDGNVELTYQIGNRSKLTYLSRSRNPAEYTDLWSGILQPLLNCGDWFMNPFAFVLKPEYLYCDRDGKAISFVYIPSKRDSSDYQGLKDMITDIAKQNQVSDVSLENQVWRALQDFRPEEFLRMLKAAGTSGGMSAAGTGQPGQPAPGWQAASQAYAPGPQAYEQARPTAGAQVPPSSPQAQPFSPQPAMPPQYAAPAPAQSPARPEPVSLGRSDDLVINLSPGAKPPQEEKPKKGLFGSRKEKEDKPKPPQKEKPPKEPKAPKASGGLFGRRKSEPEPEREQVIMQGAAAAPIMPSYAQPAAAPYSPASPYPQAAAPPYPQAPGYDDGSTQIQVRETGAAGFRYVGNQSHPRMIEVQVAGNGIFTIGRFDANVGQKQSDFEFDGSTKAVSRRHAVVERNAGGYSLIDLNSSAGTYINGQRLQPNVPSPLEAGCRVSFGNAGADYVWEI